MVCRTLKHYKVLFRRLSLHLQELQTTKEKIDQSLSNTSIVVTEEEKATVKSFDSIHFALLKDLASIKANKNDSITDLETSISSLKLYSNAGVGVQDEETMRQAMKLVEKNDIFEIKMPIFCPDRCVF